ncbi:hypothetical protein DBT_0649 [Dissulfuribacter thermophilus]|uniref:Cytoplasmic protein n=2 Tax=Dissulfuribacter thermophilus TaxID=1156395 RepID=A0A1B9F7E4_9BACT|nr:hypothetical protein DBT_0649 [Dissulfuribacter thermophilus]
MLKHDLIKRNPLRLLDSEGSRILGEGEFGGVVARAGVGKTAFLVQVAMDSLLNGKNVLHISLDQPVKKVCLWYEEVFNSITEEYNFKNGNTLWEEILLHRFIMTFKSGDFNIEILEERLNDLIEQGIFFPQVCLVDGLKFDETVREILNELKLLAKDQGFPCWFSIKSHRDEPKVESGFPVSLAQVEDLFDVVFELAPSTNEIEIRVLKDKAGRFKDPGDRVVLDPSTFLMKKSD